MPGDAKKLLAKARRSPSGLSLRELESLYLGHGFVIRRGTRHAFATHPAVSPIRGTIPNHTTFSPEYVRDAVKLIDRVTARRRGDRK